MLLAQTVFFLIVHLLCWVAPAVAQDSVTTMEAHNDKYTARLLQQKTVWYKGEPKPTWTFVVTNKKTHQETVLQLQDETNQIEGLALVNDLLVVLASNRYEAETATLFDVPTKQQKDFIWGYKLGLSATKRYLIYDQFYPHFSDAGARSDVILLYDLSKSPLENRMGPKTPKLDTWEVGYPIFPEENIQKQVYREWIEDEQDRHSVTPWGVYLWLEDDKKVVFFDDHKGAVWLVLVDLSEGLQQARLRKKILDEAKIAAEVLVVDPTSKDPVAWLQAATKDLRIKSLAQRTEGKVLIQLDPDFLQNYQYKTLEVEVPLP